MANATSAPSISGVNKAPPRHGERHTLSPETELRLELSSNTTATLTLLQGSAEVFGAEMALERPYTLAGNNKIAIFTWHGCVLDVELDNENKQLDISYTSDETVANIAFVNTHAQLEALRDEAWNDISNNSESKSNGPRVMLVGPADCGKSSLSRILLAYGTFYSFGFFLPSSFCNFFFSEIFDYKIIGKSDIMN